MRGNSFLLLVAILGIGILAGFFLASQRNSEPAQNEYETDRVNNSMEYVAGNELNIRTLADLNKIFVDISKSVNPSVVTVFTERVIEFPRRHPFEGGGAEYFYRQNQIQQPDDDFRSTGLASGVILDANEGYIITNHHVIDNAETIRVRLIDRRSFAAEVIGTDPQTDIAILQIDADDLTSIRLGDSDLLESGEWILAIGSPLSPELAHSVTFGIVSATGRAGVGIAEYEDFIQTDAPINPGNSGGALVNVNGELVGINSAIASVTGGFHGIGFAVPVNMVSRVMESLLEHGEVIRGWMGVSIQSVNEIIAEQMELPVAAGAIVAEIQRDGPAERAGLQLGDVISRIDDEEILGASHLKNEIASRLPDSEIQLTILRQGEEEIVNVTLGRLERQ